MRFVIVILCAVVVLFVGAIVYRATILGNGSSGDPGYGLSNLPGIAPEPDPVQQSERDNAGFMEVVGEDGQTSNNGRNVTGNGVENTPIGDREGMEAEEALEREQRVLETQQEIIQKQGELESQKRAAPYEIEQERLRQEAELLKQQQELRKLQQEQQQTQEMEPIYNTVKPAPLNQPY